MATGQISCNDADLLSGNTILRYKYLELFYHVPTYSKNLYRSSFKILDGTLQKNLSNKHGTGSESATTSTTKVLDGKEVVQIRLLITMINIMLNVCYSYTKIEMKRFD